jgi:hypothetical protein
VKKVPKSSRGLWAIRVLLPTERPAELAATVEAVLEPLGVALSSFEGAGGKGWSVEVLCEQRPRAAVVRSALKAIGAPPAVIAYVPPKNWVAETQRLLAPLRIGRFFIHGAHFEAAAARRDPAADRRQHRLRHRPARDDARLPAGARPAGASGWRVGGRSTSAAAAASWRWPSRICGRCRCWPSIPI